MIFNLDINKRIVVYEKKVVLFCFFAVFGGGGFL